MQVCSRSSLTRRCLTAIIIMSAVCMLLIKSGYFEHFPNSAIVCNIGNVSIGEIRRLRSTDFNVTFQPILHRWKNGDPETVLTSIIYRSNKTSFEDSFPPNSNIASTLYTEFTIENFNICNQTYHIDYIVVVHSAINHWDRRQSIRSTWGRRNLIQGLSSRTIFLLGQTDDMWANERLMKENSLYGDIIQGKFSDTYDNLMLKNVMGLRWVSTYCSNAKRVIKVDDDVFVDIFKARELYFSQLDTFPKQIICAVGADNIVIRTKHIKRDPSLTKWIVPDNYFKGLVKYPMPFCFGFAVFISIDLAKALHQAALTTPVYPLDDVYVYGILASTVNGTTWRNEESKFSKNEEDTLVNWGCDGQNTVIVGTISSGKAAKALWNKTLKCLQ